MKTPTRSRALTAAIAVLIAGPMLTACGGGGDKPETTAENYFHALGDKKSGDACKLMTTDDGKKAIKDDDKQLKKCQDLLDKSLKAAQKKDLEEFSKVKITGSTVDGDTATIKSDQVEGVDAEGSGTMKLVKVDGSWLIDAKELFAS